MHSVQEATVGIEPTNKGFADPCLTTWLRRLERGKFYHVLPFSASRVVGLHVCRAYLCLPCLGINVILFASGIRVEGL